VIALAVTMALAAASPPPVLAIYDMAFVVPARPLTAGKTLLVRNDDVFQHSATVKGVFDLDLKPGQSGSVVLSRAGTYEVTCRYHPTMKAKLVVRPAHGKP
jgi:plastocyanin